MARKKAVRKTKKTKAKRSRKKARRVTTSNRSRAKKVTPTRMSAQPVDNRRVCSAINTLSSFCHGCRGGSADRASAAVQYLSSLDYKRMSTGRRGGLTMRNATAILDYLARWEMSTGKKLKNLGGFKRADVEAAKKIIER
ncbi:MAG: hypothetical protein IT377_31055 [Polyangiaceae bacterium]|nr:hypothetical protein [Polyangiaceae bacterium]